MRGPRDVWRKHHHAPLSGRSSSSLGGRRMKSDAARDEAEGEWELHPLAVADPVMSSLVQVAMVNHVVKNVRGTYSSATKSFLLFCSLRDLRPWPADGFMVAAWLRDLASSVAVASFKMYLAGIRYHQILCGFPWMLDGDEQVRRMLRFLKRKFPGSAKAAKVPVTLGVLRAIFPLLAGWPDARCMSHDDRLFVAASLVAVAGFLRGGEFLSSRKSDRPILTAALVRIVRIEGSLAVRVSIRQPKAMWWVEAQDVPCFARKEAPSFCPVLWWDSFSSLSPKFVRASGLGRLSSLPAFHRASGAPLSRDWMVGRTSELMAGAGIEIKDAAGKPSSVKASSWRAGGVRSAANALISGPTIKLLGRWSSDAWESYLMESARDLLRASQQMWKAACEGVCGSVRLWVGEASEVSA